jgi:hypothetical protein
MPHDAKPWHVAMSICALCNCKGKKDMLLLLLALGNYAGIVLFLWCLPRGEKEISELRLC